MEFLNSKPILKIKKAVNKSVKGLQKLSRRVRDTLALLVPAVKKVFTANFSFLCQW